MPTLFSFQAEALKTLRNKRVHLALTAPTGSGKGRILEELAQNLNERILLFSPLVALGRQQLARFSSRGIPCRSSIGRLNAYDSDPRVWITSPESALFPRNREEIGSWKPTLVAVDEAHCLHEWGENFRPAYQEIIPFLQELGTQRSLWMSATFPRHAVKRLMNEFSGNWRTQGTFELPKNLKIEMKRVRSSDRIELVHKLIRTEERAGILFAGTRKNVERYQRLFGQTGMRCLPYHAGLSDEERRSVEKVLQFESEKRSGGHCVIATNAFGMGMDYPQLEWAVLAQSPFSLLSLMQSFGRVARAGRVGRAALYWAEEDFRVAGYLSRKPDDLEELRAFLEASPSGRETFLKSLLL